MIKKTRSVKFSKLYKKWYFILIIAFFLTLIINLISSFPFLVDIEKKVLDYRFILDPTVAKADTNILIIAIDDSSLDFFSENGISWPWPRSFYGHVVNFLTRAEVRSVLFDMQFYEKDIEREETTAEETDDMFAEAIRANGNVYLGSQMLHDANKINSKVYNFARQTRITDLPAYNGIRAPIEPFLLSTKSIGIINTEPDNDGLIRRVGLHFNLNDNYFSQIAYGVWLDQNNSLKTDNIPVDKDGNYLLNWYGVDAFKTYPFKAVIASASAVMNNADPILQPDLFKDKNVIIGATAAGLYDLKSNSYSKIMPGMEIWATALSNYINSDFITVVPNWNNFLITFVTIFLILYLISNYLQKKANFYILIILLGIILLNFAFWKYYRIQFNFTQQILGIIIAYLLINTYSYFLEGKSRREIRKIFTRYLHDDVIKQLEEDPKKVYLGGKEIEATVVYTDIYNFTTLSETKTPSELVQDLNEYFKEIIDYIFQFNGLLDKYTGDGIMALFGAPIERSEHALLACRAAYSHKELQRKLKDKTNLSAVEELHLKTRIGINSGPLVAGNIGGEKRMDYTAIGDTVNLAARLEGVNKIYQTNIIISENTYYQVKEEFICRELDSLKVKGKTIPTRIYEIIDKKQEIDNPQKYKWISNYEKALKLYREKDWQQAGEVFQELSEDPYNDSASKVMFTRCLYLLEYPPKEWDGVIKLDVK
ncbi:MAG: adenylate/guanylate cyclase domain-containing protein [Candidatus Cloacimonetes bacterium]|nr:adenylate/guanylate cyclase domain-containing protein [Candidatus Cloacimonadota bacterium]